MGYQEKNYDTRKTTVKQQAYVGKTKLLKARRDDDHDGSGSDDDDDDDDDKSFA